jgi:toxin ParE1/3/4
MAFKVLLTDNALRDLEEILKSIAIKDSKDAAASILSHIEKVFKHLEAFPNRGNHPKELAALGIKDFREAHVKPYRIIYRVTAKFVYVELIADGRRNMQSLLSRRMLQS